MSASCAGEELAALGNLDLEGLRTAWRHRFGEPPPLRSVELLALLLAPGHHLQKNMNKNNILDGKLVPLYIPSVEGGTICS